jgi:exopolysaccharide biosynthesis operon protein EpsL
MNGVFGNRAAMSRTFNEVKEGNEINGVLSGKIFCRALAATALAGITFSAGAWDTVKLRASTTFRADNNVFRLPEGVNPTAPDGSAGRGDFIRTLSTGISAEIPVSRQKFLFSYDVNQTQYSRFSNLDFSGEDRRVLWKWEFGRLATGNAGMSQTKTGTDFATSLGSAPNAITATRQFINGSYPFHANWQSNWGVTRVESRNSDTVNRVSDNISNTINGDLRYLSGTGNHIGLQWTHSAADFPNPTVVGTTALDNGYKQDTLGLIAGYNIGGATSLQSSLSRARRDPVQTGSSTTTATTGTASLNWQPSGKSTLAIFAARDFSPPENVTVSGSLLNSVGLTATWRATGKITVRGNTSWQNREFLFVPGAALAKRTDTIVTQGISVSYAALDQLQITLSATRERRDSDLPSAIYDARGASLAVELNF